MGKIDTRMDLQAPKNRFETTALYYDALAGGAKRLEREGPLLRECLRQAPGRRVVDLACGTGLHTLFMAEAGAEVTALDVSPAMIAYAEGNRPHPRIAYGVGDMCFPFGGPWDLALCLGNSLSLLATRDALTSVFQGVANALAPGGLFLVQVLNYGAPSAQEPRHRVERYRFGNEEVTAVKSLVPDGERTLLSIVFHVVRGGDVRSVVDTAVLSHWSSMDLRVVAETAGLSVVSEYGAFDSAPFEVSSPDLIVVAEKRGVA